jgi:fructose/tagatose bisphosphate aldolase
VAADPAGDAPGPRPEPRRLPGRHRPGLQLGDDGRLSLKADGKTIASYDYNVDVTRKVVDMAHKVGVTVEGELGCLGSLETMRGDKEDGHGTDATMTASSC